MPGAIAERAGVRVIEAQLQCPRCRLADQTRSASSAFPTSM